jgi:hypothetical protein
MNENRWPRCLSAEVDFLMVREILDELHLGPYIRRFKTTAGHTLSQNPGDLIDCIFEGVTESFKLVVCFFRNQSEQTIPSDDSFMRSYVLLSELLEAAEHIETIARTSPTSGWGITNRYFAASASPTPLRRTEKDKRTESSPPLWTFPRTGTYMANESQYKTLSWKSESPPVWDLI